MFKLLLTRADMKQYVMNIDANNSNKKMFERFVFRKFTTCA